MKKIACQGVLFILITLLLSKISCAQFSMYDWKSVKNITTLQGLPSNFTDVLMQDSKGFLWFATYNGVARYDGMSFKKYEFNIGDSNSILPDWFTGIVEAKDGTIWITSANSGIYELNPANDKIEHYRHQPGNNNSLADDQITGVLTDSAGLIWIATFGGLNSYNPQTGQFKWYGHRDNDATTLSHSQLWKICFDDDKNIWVATATGIDQFNIHTGKVIKHINDSAVINLKRMQDYPLVVAHGLNNTVWIICKNTGLWGYDVKKEKFFRHFYHDKNDSSSIQTNDVQSIFEDRFGNLWISAGDEAAVYEKSTGKKMYNEAAGNSMKNANTFSSMIQDITGKIWIATGLNGIITVDLHQKMFHILPDESANNKPVRMPDVLTLRGLDQYRLLATIDNSVYIYDKRNNSFTPFKLFYKGRELTSEGFITCSYLDKKGVLFLGTELRLITYDTTTKAIHIYEHSIHDPASISEISCTGIICDRAGRYWCAAYGGGLNRFYPETGKFNAFKVHAGKNSISTNSVHNLFEDLKGIIYVGCTGGGFIRFNPDAADFTVYRHDSKNPESPSNDNAEYFFESKQGYIYFTTIGGGLNVFDPVKKKFKAFTTNDGFASNLMHGLITGNDNLLWIGTDGGISSFAMPENPFEPGCKLTIRNYNVSDGLPCNEILFGGVHKDADGTLYFGTSCGRIVFFNPSELKDNTFVPPVYITGFSLFNKPVIPSDNNEFMKTTIEHTKEITLSYKENVISFSFAALNYVHPENNRYAYMLEGFDKNWNYTDATKRFANYTNLSAREYIFKVKGSNNDGVWNDTPAMLKLIITPPFWETWPFRLLVLLIIAAAVYSLYRFRLHQILKVQVIRNKISSDLHDDIGSTLNSISVYSEVAKQKSKGDIHELELIGESSRKVMDAMSDIVWTINPENDSFEKIIFRMRSLTHQLMKAKKIEYTFDADESLNLLKLPMQTRKNFYLIFKEALNNLVKYSRATRAGINLNGNKNTLSLSIRDNGTGFDSLNPPRGNGLNNMKRRAEEINAQIKIESLPGTGTTIELTMKLNK